MMKPRKDGFTLIEMLVVIVVVGILVALAVPAATNLMKSGGLNSAAREVSNSLGLARQYAITHRTTTCVVFPCSRTTGTPGTNFAPWYQSYAVVDVGSTTNYLSKWETLPPGTIFMNNSPFLAGAPPPIPILDNLATISLHFPYTNSPLPLVKLACIQFKPWGTASQSGTFTITEGFMNGGVPVPTSISAGALANIATVSVDSIIGQIQVARP